MPWGIRLMPSFAMLYDGTVRQRKLCRPRRAEDLLRTDVITKSLPVVRAWQGKHVKLQLIMINCPIVIASRTICDCPARGRDDDQQISASQRATRRVPLCASLVLWHSDCRQCGDAAWRSSRTIGRSFSAVWVPRQSPRSSVHWRDRISTKGPKCQLLSASSSRSCPVTAPRTSWPDETPRSIASESKPSHREPHRAPHPGRVIRSGRTRRSKSSAVTYPSRSASSRKVVPFACAALAISAPRS